MNPNESERFNDILIAFVIQKIAGRSGGAERVLVETANELAKRGFRVEIISYENRGIGPFYTPREDVRHRNLFRRPIDHRMKKLWKGREYVRERIPHFFPMNILKWKITYGGFIRALQKYIRDEKPAILIPFLPPAITVCAFASRNYPNVNVVASTHNVPAQDYENPRRWDSNPSDIRRRREALEYIDKILVLLPEYKEWYPEKYHSKISEMPNAVIEIDKSKLLEAKREKIVMAVGRLTDVKRFDVLIESWARLKNDFPDWKVEIYGEGPGRKKLERLIFKHELSECVLLKGVTGSIGEKYLEASVLAHPAEHEGFPLAVTEALAHGLPVVGFDDCTGLNSLVEDGVNGILVDNRGSRVKNFTNSLKRILSDSEMRSTLSDQAPDSMSQYKPEIVFGKWESIVMQQIDGGV